MNRMLYNSTNMQELIQKKAMYKKYELWKMHIRNGLSYAEIGRNINRSRMTVKMSIDIFNIVMFKDTIRSIYKRYLLRGFRLSKFNNMDNNNV